MNEITDALRLPADQRQARLKELFSGNNKPRQRVYLGRKTDQSAALQLKDLEGRDRIVMMVAADGTPSLQFLDDQGKVIKQFPTQ